MSSNENLAPASVRRIMREIADLTQTPPEGIKLIQNDEDVSDIQAVIDGPAGTPYEGGYFRVKLKLGPDFPQAPPKGFFLTKIFHPNVSNKGEICVNTLKKDWKPDLGIKHILLTVKCLLIVPNPESALNEEAGKLLLERYEDYAKHARLMTTIHAKKPIMTNETSSSATSATSAANALQTDAMTTSATSSSAAGTGTDQTSPKKRAAVKEVPSNASSAALRQKVEKKKSLKRL